MGWYDDMIGGITDHYDGGGVDWTAGGSGGSDSWWGGMFSDGSSGSTWGKIWDWGSGLLGGGGSGGSGNIYEGILGGLGGAADALISKEAVEEQGKQHRKTTDFTASLEDYYKQKDKVRKRGALDTYGQFSTVDRWAPNAQPARPIDMPSKPGY